MVCNFCDIIMDSRVGSLSPAPRCSSPVRQQTWKRSSFCPNSTSKWKQSIVKDHMVSHYKKVYSAKAVIDNSAPKSLVHCIKYKDRIRQEQLSKWGQPQSAHSFSQMNIRASCSSAQGRFCDDRPYLCSRSSTVSSPRFGTSFHTNDIVYASCKVGSQNLFHQDRPASEIKYRSPKLTPQRKQSACSLGASRDLRRYKTFQDPGQKTHSGDLLKKHSQHSTQDKPFTPKTLKSDKSSYLSKYRYYRAPMKISTQVSPQSRSMQQETPHESTKAKECEQESYEPSQGINTEHESSDDEFNGSYILESKQPSLVNNSRDRTYFDSSSSVSPERGKSSTVKNVSSEEEELMYLEFISTVTEDILSRGFISERVVNRVTKHHIDINRNHLDEGKMHHLLDALFKDFYEPDNKVSCHAELDREANALLDAFLPRPEGRRVKPEENNDLLSVASPLKCADLFPASLPGWAFERTDSSNRANGEKGAGDNLDQGIKPPSLSKCLSYDGVNENDLHQSQTGINVTSGHENYEYASITSEKGFQQDQVELSSDEQSKELEDLGECLSSTLHVSSNTPSINAETSEEPAVSDDEF